MANSNNDYTQHGISVMQPEQKQLELVRHRSILLATLDYLEKLFGGSFVCDQYDPLAEYYQQQKIQTEKYFRQLKLDRLQQQLVKLTRDLQNRVDLNFAGYIKENTGYDIDIFEDLRKRVDAIIEHTGIRSENELNDIGTMMHYYEVMADGEKVERFDTLLTNYSEGKHETSGKRKSGYSEVISRVEKDGIEEVTISVSTGPKPRHFNEQEEVSPDGKRRLRVTQWGDRKHASTSVAIEFPAASGAGYGTSGIHPDIKAWWKGNSTIVIETKKEYEASVHHKEVRSFDDVITIDYIEN
jgi:hypothetical protein